MNLTYNLCRSCILKKSTTHCRLVSRLLMIFFLVISPILSNCIFRHIRLNNSFYCKHNKTSLNVHGKRISPPPPGKIETIRPELNFFAVKIVSQSQFFRDFYLFCLMRCPLFSKISHRKKTTAKNILSCGSPD